MINAFCKCLWLGSIALPSSYYHHRSSKKLSSEVIVVLDEDPVPSPDSSGSSGQSNNMSKVSSSSGYRKDSGSGGSGGGVTAESHDPSVQALRELLQKEEKKLSVLKTIHGLQGSINSSKSSSIQGSALNKTSGRSTGGSGSGRSSPSMRGVSQKHSIVVVPGNQAIKSSSSMTPNISPRLQHIVDTIAVDQSLNSDKLNKKSQSANNNFVVMTTPPVPGLTSLSSSSKLSLKTSTGSGVPQLRPKFTSNSNSTSSSIRSASTHEIITISDSPMSKPPPPLLSTNISSSKVPIVTSNGSIHVPTIFSKSGDTFNHKNYSLHTTENTRRYREQILEQAHKKKALQKRLEHKMKVAPYPKMFRQVWPLIPVHDSSFVRNFGLESVMHHFDPNSKTNQGKSSSKVKPICNQCGCDFASAWQIRKSNSKQLLLCEACDFQNLKILQRSKLSNQLKELLESVKKEEEELKVSCERELKQLLDLERQQSSTESPPPLTNQSTTTQGVVSHVNQVVLNNQVTSKLQSLTNSSSQSHLSSNGIMANKPSVVIPSILGQSSRSERVAGTKRKAGDQDGASKVCKPGSVLDLTLNRLSEQLIKRKLNEQRQECQEQEMVVAPTETTREENKSVTRSAAAAVVEDRESSHSPVPGDSIGRRTRSRRKGTPKHKRLLSASSID